MILSIYSDLTDILTQYLNINCKCNKQVDNITHGPSGYVFEHWHVKENINKLKY